MIDERELKEVYEEDTKGRKYHSSILSQKGWVDFKQAEKQHGEVHTFNPNKCITKREFLELTDDLKRVYITTLRKKYNVTNIEIAFSMGWDNSALGKEIKRLGISKGRQKYKKTVAQEKAWQDFLSSGDVTEKAAQIKAKTKEELGATVCNLHFEQVGELNAELIAKRISALIADGVKCKVAITIETVEV